MDSAFCKGSITKESGRAQSDRFYKRKWPLLIGHGLSDFACRLTCWLAGEGWGGGGIHLVQFLAHKGVLGKYVENIVILNSDLFLHKICVFSPVCPPPPRFQT